MIGTYLSLLLFLILHLLLHLLHLGFLLLLLCALRIAGVAGTRAESGLVLVPVLAVLLLSSDLRDFGAQRRGWCRCVRDGHFVLSGTICYGGVLIADYWISSPSPRAAGW
jgi:hypothetical protein